MRAHEGRVDHGVFVVGVDRQVLEHPLPYAGLGPATEAGLHRDPTAEPLGQIAPGDARPIAVEHRLHEEPVILGGHAHMPDPPRQQILDPRPLIISYAVFCLKKKKRSSPASFFIPHTGMGKLLTVAVLRTRTHVCSALVRFLLPDAASEATLLSLVGSCR